MNCDRLRNQISYARTVYGMNTGIAAVQVCLGLVIIIVLSAVNVTCAAHAEWSHKELQWLEAMSPPDYVDGDFGSWPAERDKALLMRFKPRVIIGPEGMLPVDFYEYYLPQTVVRDRERYGKIVKNQPSREYLKGIERDRRFYLDYVGQPIPRSTCVKYTATGYGRVFRETTTFRGDNGMTYSVPIIVLKYNFVFPFSGLPKRIGFFREILSEIVGDPERWHELDIHGAVQLVLNEREKPMAVILAQHNHFRTYLAGKDLPWPGDGRVPVCFAERSNEPYPCPPGTAPVSQRAVGNPKYIAYVIDGRDPPFLSGEDVVYGPGGGGREVGYHLKFLPDKDPLYESWIPLGDRGKVLFFDSFYRQGPPGIDFNTWPELKTYGNIMQFWYVRDGNKEDADVMQESIRDFFDVDFETVLRKNGGRLFRDMRDLGLFHDTAAKTFKTSEQ